MPGRYPAFFCPYPRLENTTIMIKTKTVNTLPLMPRTISIVIIAYMLNNV